MAELSDVVRGRREDALVFGNGQTHLQQPTAHGDWYIAATRKAKRVDPTFPAPTIHDLRHAAASLLVSAGANVKAVQRMLSHPSAVMTLGVYTDLVEEDLEAVPTALDASRSAALVGDVWGLGRDGVLRLAEKRDHMRI